MGRPGQPPAFLFYPDDFCGDGKVEAMPVDGVGAYILLLCKAWRESPPGSLPNDDVILARWARMDSVRWAELRSVVLAPFLMGTDLRWHQKRMRHEWDCLMDKRAKAKASAEKRWKGGLDAKAMRTHSDGIARAVALPLGINPGLEEILEDELRLREKLRESERVLEANEIVRRAEVTAVEATTRAQQSRPRPPDPDDEVVATTAVDLVGAARLPLTLARTWIGEVGRLAMAYAIEQCQLAGKRDAHYLIKVARSATVEKLERWKSNGAGDGKQNAAGRSDNRPPQTRGRQRLTTTDRGEYSEPVNDLPIVRTG